MPTNVLATCIKDLSLPIFTFKKGENYTFSYDTIMLPEKYCEDVVFDGIDTFIANYDVHNYMYSVFKISVLPKNSDSVVTLCFFDKNTYNAPNKEVIKLVGDFMPVLCFTDYFLYFFRF